MSPLRKYQSSYTRAKPRDVLWTDTIKMVALLVFVLVLMNQV
jgi:hypothetical protein